MSRAIVLAVAFLLPACCAQAAQAQPSEEKKDAQQQEKPAEPAGPKSAADPLQIAAPKVDRTAAPGAPVDLKNFIIGAEDVLVIRVWREAELSGQYVVRPDGKISLPLVNELQAAGLTPEQLKRHHRHQRSPST